MCGISGIILKAGEFASSTLTDAMAADMFRRGPDAQTSFTKDNFSFSHRRLKIIDISDEANQPIFNEKRDVAVLFNGEIYNYLELREQLKGLGHQFQTQSDTEVIVHAFEQWGIRSFEMFNGMFAFALWDGRERENIFYLVRDRLGIKPLFYAANENRIGFASELKPLFRLPWVKKCIDPQTLFHYLKFSHVPNPQSMIKDISQLEPGHFLKIGKNIEKHCFFDVKSGFLSEKNKRRKTSQDWEEEFESLLLNVVKRQQISDVPIGCFLSGGIDSSLLTMAFSAINSSKIKTFSIGYKEAEWDESVHAREVANIFQTEHNELILFPEDLQDLIRDIPKYFDQPFADPSLLPTLHLAKFARQQVTVALSGDGADELFFGYEYQRYLDLIYPLKFAPNIIRQGIFGAAEPVMGLFSDRLRKLAEVLQFNNESELFMYFVGTVGPMKMSKLKSALRHVVDIEHPIFDLLLENINEFNWHDKIIYIFMKTFLVDTVLTKSDRASMAYGLEARVPFLDNEMLAFAGRLPFSQKFEAGLKKKLLRAVLGKKVPPSISKRKKQGFGIPLKEWLRGDLSYLLDEYIMSDRFDNDPYLDPKFTRRLAVEHMRGTRNHSHLLWSIICFQLWREEYQIT